MFGMHKPWRLVIKCKPNVNFCTMSIWVSIHIYFFFHICVYLFCFVYLINYILLLLYAPYMDCKK